MKKTKQTKNKKAPTEKQMAELAEAYKSSDDFCKGMMVGLMSKRLIETKDE